MCHCKGHRCFITLSAVTSGPTISLPENQRIRNSRILSLQVRRNDGVIAQTNKAGQTLASAGVIASAHLSLLNENGTQIMDIPVQALTRDYNYPEPLAVDYKQIDPVQSTITLNTSASGYSATAVIEITFELDCNECGISA